MTAIPKNPNKVKKTRGIFDRKPPKSQMGQWKRPKCMTAILKNLNAVNESTKNA